MISARRNASIRLEKGIIREGKTEGDSVKQELKELERLDKELGKVRKSAGRADSVLGKRGKYEHKTAKSMNEAIHEHDIAVAKLRAAEKDAKLKHDHLAQLAKAIEVKRDSVEKAIQYQEEHEKMRETKLAQIRGASVFPTVNPAAPPVKKENISLPGQSGPAVDNEGHAAGYGVDFNHTAVDSEGNARGITNCNGDPATSHNIDGHGYN